MGNAESGRHTTAPESVDMGYAHQLSRDDGSERRHFGLYDLCTKQREVHQGDMGLSD
jgi:hypothetical protein